MSEQLAITTERVDDIPVLIAQAQHMGLAELLDEHFPPHGNWQGLSLGHVCTGWLSHILSEADHRMNHVRPWADKRKETLSKCLGQPIRPEDWTDEHLASVLLALSDDDRWARFESALSGHLVRVYDLKPRRIHLDATTASGYWQVTEDGLFQFGPSKDHRPNQPQVKIMLSVLDPLGLPVATQVVSGERADDRLYVPAIQQVREGLQQTGLLYVGDCKMMALEPRAFVQAGGDFYLGPFPKVQVSDDVLDSYLQPVWDGTQPLMDIYRPNKTDPSEKIAEGYELTVTLQAIVHDQPLTWTERRLVIRSLKQVESLTLSLHARLKQAEANLARLSQHQAGRAPWNLDKLRQAAEKIVRQHQVEGLLELVYEDTVQERWVQRYKTRPAELRTEHRVHLHIRRREEIIQHTLARFGWRVYGTNQPADQLSLVQAVWAYRSEFLVEHSFGRLKGRPLSLTPMYVQDDQHATGLIRLLSLGLRLLTLVEFVVRRRLAENQESLPGLYAGQPNRTTARPTAEALLQAFKEITLTVVHIGSQVHRHVTPPSELQQRILQLLGLPPDLYMRLTIDFSRPP